MMHQPKVVVLDLDGTLLNSSKQISKRSIDVLNQLRQRGIDLIFATARPPRVTSFKELHLASIGTMIYYNGALFNCTTTNQHVHFGIDGAMTKRVINFSEQLDPQANISLEVKDQWFSSKALDYRELMHVEKNPTVIKKEQLLTLECTKILLTDFPYAKELTNKFKDELNVMTTDQGRLIQIMSKKASKNQAVKHILKARKLSFEDTICFGDDYNDLGLFQSCGYSVAMDNAVDQLKDLADEVTARNDQDGVAIVLERFIQ